MGAGLTRKKNNRLTDVKTDTERSAIVSISYTNLPELNHTHISSRRSDGAGSYNHEITLPNYDDNPTETDLITSENDEDDIMSIHNSVDSASHADDPDYDVIPQGIDRNDALRRSTTISEDSAFSDRSSMVECDGTIYTLETEKLIPYMIEAFKPLIEGSILVMDILPPLLSVIDDHDAISQKDKESHRDAVRMLLHSIDISQEAGKWQSFLDALNVAEYQYIVRLLKGETEEDQIISRKILKLFTPQIINRIDPREFVDHLYANGVIGELDKDAIEREDNNRGPIAASFLLLDRIPRKLPNWYDIFMDVLIKCGMGDVVDSLSGMTLVDNCKNRKVCTDRPPLPPRDGSLPRHVTGVIGHSEFNNTCTTLTEPSATYSCQIQSNKQTYSKSQRRSVCSCQDIKDELQRVDHMGGHGDMNSEQEHLDRKQEHLRNQIAEHKLRKSRREVQRLQQQLDKLKEEDEDSYIEIPEDDPYIFETVTECEEPIKKHIEHVEDIAFNSKQEEINDDTLVKHVYEVDIKQREKLMPLAETNEGYNNQNAEQMDELHDRQNNKQIQIEDDYSFDECNDALGQVTCNQDYVNSDTNQKDRTSAMEDYIQKALTADLQSFVNKMTDTLKEHISQEIRKMSNSQFIDTNNYTNVEQVDPWNIPMPLYRLSNQRQSIPFIPNRIGFTEHFL